LSLASIVYMVGCIAKHGNIHAMAVSFANLQVVIPRPSQQGPDHDPAGVGLVFLEYEDVVSAESSFGLERRMFGEKPVVASVFDQDLFNAQLYK